MTASHFAKRLHDELDNMVRHCQESCVIMLGNNRVSEAQLDAMRVEACRYTQGIIARILKETSNGQPAPD